MMGQKIFLSLVALAFFYVASPLLLPVIMGGVLAVLFKPWQERLEKRKMSPSLSSAILTFGVTVTLILPLSILVFFAVKTAFFQLQLWKTSSSAGYGFFDTLMRMPKVYRLLTWITHHFPLTMQELVDALHEFLLTTGARLTEVLGGVLTQLPGVGIVLAVTVMSIYFFLIDGKSLVLFFRRNSVFSPHQTNRLIQSIGEMCRSVILAAVVSGGMQALLEVLTGVLTGTPQIALIGLMVFIGSFIPVVGSAPITIGVGLYQLLEGRQAAGIILLVMAVVIVAVDNTVRPLVLKGSANLHPLLAFVAAFGGLETLGFVGIFLGPILASLFVVTLQILTQPHDLSESA